MAAPARLVLAVSLVALLAGCVGDAGPEAMAEAPDVTIAGARGPFHLGAMRGRPVVLQFAPADSLDAWAALADAHRNLEASGAVVFGVATDGLAPESPYNVGTDPDGKAATAFGYRGAPLAVVIDPSGRIRGHVAPRHASDLYALTAPVLVEMEDARGVTSPAEAAALRRASTVIVDLRPHALRRAEGALPYALVADPATLAAIDLPADLALPIVLVGPAAEGLAASVVGWGYGDVQVIADADGLLLDPAAPPIPDPPPAPRRRTVRG